MSLWNRLTKYLKKVNAILLELNAFLQCLKHSQVSFKLLNKQCSSENDQVMSWAKNLGYVIKQPMSKKTQQTLKDLELSLKTTLKLLHNTVKLKKSSTGVCICVTIFFPHRKSGKHNFMNLNMWSLIYRHVNESFHFFKDV